MTSLGTRPIMRLSSEEMAEALREAPSYFAEMPPLLFTRDRDSLTVSVLWRGERYRVAGPAALERHLAKATATTWAILRAGGDPERPAEMSAAQEAAVVATMAEWKAAHRGVTS